MATDQAAEVAQVEDRRPIWWGYRERGREYVHVTSEAVARRVRGNNPGRYELVWREDGWRVVE